MQTDARVNAMLDTEFALNDVMSLHSAYSITGANELTGGGYARQVITWAAAAARSKAASAAVPDFSVAAASTVAFVGVWNSAGTVFRGMWPNGGAEKTFQVDVLNNRIYCESHGMVDTNRVVFTGTTAPTGLTLGTVYYVVTTTAADPDHFQVSATSGGAAIDITGLPSADCVVSKAVVEVYSGAGTHRITAFSHAL